MPAQSILQFKGSWREVLVVDPVEFIPVVGMDAVGPAGSQFIIQQTPGVLQPRPLSQEQSRSVPAFQTSTGVASANMRKYASLSRNPASARLRSVMSLTMACQRRSGCNLALISTEMVPPSLRRNFHSPE